MSATKSARRERGSSLVLVLMFATTIASFCLFSLASSQGVYKTAKNGLETTRAFYLAEGGADYALSQLAQDPYWAASSVTDLPTVKANGSFESDWLQLGTSGGVYKLNIAYAKTNKVPSTFVGTGFPVGFEPLSIVTFLARTNTPTYDRMIITSTGKYNGVSRTVTANVKSQMTAYSGAIISDATPIAGSGSGKSWSIDKQTVVMDGMNQYVWGGIRANGGIYLGGSSTPLSKTNVESSLTHFSGEFKSNLLGTSEELPDFTDAGASTQLFDFGRFRAAAAAGAGATYTVDQFVAAMNTANAANVPLEGIIYVTVDASHSASLSNITGSKGINIKGSLVFHFTNVTDDFYKIVIDKALHINAATMPSFDPTNATTFATGYPPTLTSSKDPRNVDITGAGYTNFGADDDLPALMFDTGTVDIHGEANVCGVVYGPSFIEIENHNDMQYFNGTVIGGAGIYVNGNNGTSASQVFVYDPNSLDTLATFANEGKAPVITAFVAGQKFMPRPRLLNGAPALVGALLAAFAAAACEGADAGPAPTRAPSVEKPKPAADDAGMRRLLADMGSARSTSRETALAALSAAGEPARRAAEAALAVDQVLLRRGGARALEKLADAQSVPSLVAALARRDPLEEDVLVRTLARVGTADAGKALVATATGDDPRRALLAGTALADFVGPLDVDALRAAASSIDRALHVREAALLALGGHASADDRAIFDAAARDAAAPIRLAAVRGLFSSDHLAAPEMRRLICDDPAPMVRRTAAREALHVRGDEVVALLASAAAEFDEDVAADAIETLAKRTEPAAFEALLDVVRDDSRSAHLRGVAAHRALDRNRDRTVAMLKKESAIFDLETRAYCDEILSAEARR